MSNIIELGHFKVTLEGTHKTSELVIKGKYDNRIYGVTNKRFPLKKHAPVTSIIELIRFGYDPTSEDVLAEFKRHGLKRPTYEDALYFGIQYHEKQREYPIVFLHKPVLSLYGIKSFILVLSEDTNGRIIGLRSFNHEWDRDYVFAGVRPSTKT